MPNSRVLRLPAMEAAAAINSSDNTARTLGVVGIVTGAVGLLIGPVALRGRPKVEE